MNPVFLALAAWRLAHLVVSDEIAQKPKDAIVDRIKNEEIQYYFSYLTNCIYCLTFWTAAIVLILKKSKLNMFFAIWAMATLIGVVHNLVTQNDDKEDVE